MAGSEEYERITHLKATMAQVRKLQADILDQVAEIERLQIAAKLGYHHTRALLMAALRVAPEVATRMVTQTGLVAETLTPTGHTTPGTLAVGAGRVARGIAGPGAHRGGGQGGQAAPGLGQPRQPHARGSNVGPDRPLPPPPGGA